MLIKAGVDISRLKRPIRRILGRLAVICWEIEKQELVITSTYEGNHSEGSLHYCNEAVDIRIWKSPRKVRAAIKQRLGNDYDVIFEGNHIHIEYDPK
jgi:hypothetical protein